MTRPAGRDVRVSALSNTWARAHIRILCFRTRVSRGGQGRDPPGDLVGGGVQIGGRPPPSLQDAPARPGGPAGGAPLNGVGGRVPPRPRPSLEVAGGGRIAPRPPPPSA